MNQIINMIIRQVMHRLVRKGVDAGFNKAAQISRKRQPAIDDTEAPSEMTREQRQARRQARQTEKNAKQSMKAVRRLNKF